MVASVRPIIVVKVGTSSLLGDHDRPSAAFENLAVQITQLMTSYRVALVTSGAIGFGVRQLALSERPQNVDQLQALSMIGQVGILRHWREAFQDTTIGQVLVTRQDLERQISRGEFRTSVEAVWGYGAVPVINENDAVSSEEISFGDNDRLAAEVASTLGATHLVLLTDQDGIQVDFGHPMQARLPQVSVEEARRHITPTRSALGKGGASSKLQAAEVALAAGVTTWIARASDELVIERTLAGIVGTKIVQ